MLLQALLLGLCALNIVSAQRTCTSVTVEPCTIRVNRDLLFLVDASDSLDPARFQREMLDYVQSLYCAFDTREINRAGLITFASEIIERIPLDRYTQAQWFSQVETIREQNICCSCCTPTADAFFEARAVFERVPIGDSFRIVFVITDGAPWQNEYGQFAWPSISSAKYTWGIVPEQAQLLKNMAGEGVVRLMLVGVPNKSGNPPRIAYFQGKPDADKVPNGKANTWQCNTRGPQKTCFQMKTPPFPIVSTPVAKNTFSSTTWNVQRLLDLTVGSLCEILPTPAPTFAPTTRGPTRSPTKTPTKQPTLRPTFAPSNGPTQSPIKPELDGVDLYFLLDRSRSMRWVPSLCRAAPGGNPEDADAVACWHLFLRFVHNLVEKTSQIPYRTTTLGWKNEHAGDLKRGIRVWLYGFACTGHQSKPVVVTIGEKLESLQAFNEAIARAETMIPDGGTCPGAAIEKVAATIQGNDLLTRIYKSVILVTDGVFYDMPRPKIAANGLFHFGVLTYSLGIAIPSNGNNWGLKPAEIKRQRNQLLTFVQGEESRLYNFGLEGLNLLDEIAREFAAQLPHDAIQHFPDVSKKPYWCGWTSIDRCTTTDPAKTATGEYCRWDAERKACVVKGWCRYASKAACEKDRYCQWKWPNCVAKPGVPV